MLAVVRKMCVRAWLGIVACAALVPAAHSTDFGDIWYVPAEAGWGLNIAHQNNLLFLTFYIFSADGRPTWITALLTRQGAGVSPPVTFTGTTYVSTGTFYGAPWVVPQPARAAGTATFTANTATTGTLTYTIDGVTVVKQIERYAFILNNLAGSYIGSFIQANLNCTNPANNGAQAASGTFTIVHPPSNVVVITAALNNGQQSYTCNYQGNYGQAGRFGLLTGGVYTCTNGDSGNFTAHEIELASQGGILGRYNAQSTTRGCQSTGGFGGLK